MTRPTRIRAKKRAVSRLSPDDRMSDLLTTARAVIAEKGYENTLLSDIAKRAGVVDGTIYRYFENKRDLMVKVAERWFGEQLVEDSQLQLVQGTQARLRYLAVRTLTIIKREPVLARYMLMELRPDPQYRSTAFFEMNKRFTDDVLLVCKDAVASGDFYDDVSPGMIRDMLHGCIEHRTWAFLRGEGDFSVEEVADGIAKVICRGMFRRPEGKSQSDLDQVVTRLEKVACTLERGSSG